MAFHYTPKLLMLCFLSTFILFLTSCSKAQLDDTSLKLMNEALELPNTMSFYDELDVGNLDEEDEMDGGLSRRSLFWHRARYYISYGALSANRVPCPPRSGRSYYTHNCFQARGPVRPYYRGCSSITRCRR